MIDLSDKNIRENCPHCNIGSQAYEFPLEETENFYVVCDAHNLNAGHILIIPKVHISCIGAYAPALYEEFTRLNVRVRQFVQQ